MLFSMVWWGKGEQEKTNRERIRNTSRHTVAKKWTQQKGRKICYAFASSAYPMIHRKKNTKSSNFNVRPAIRLVLSIITIVDVVFPFSSFRLFFSSTTITADSLSAVRRKFDKGMGKGVFSGLKNQSKISSPQKICSAKGKTRIVDADSNENP